MINAPLHPHSLGTGSRSGIVWLASYPKSGNTWFRIFLRYLLCEREDNEKVVGVNGMACQRDLFDELSGLDSSILTDDEIDGLRPMVYEELAARYRCADSPLFVKAHDAYTYLPHGAPLFSRKATAGAIYFVRNPLDVAVSFAYHAGHGNFSRTVDDMAKTGKCVQESREGLSMQLRQRVLDWSGHVSSWLDQLDVPVHIVRYEDMLASPLETFRGAIRFAGLDHNDSQVAAALEQCRFEKLQQKERENGFYERPLHAKVFFREGKAGGWRDKLTDDLVVRVIAQHGEVMRKLCYVDENYRP